jgi:ketosteroid isomerase-like protein
MSEENVELAYRAFDAINRRDLHRFLALMDDDVEIVSRIVAMEGGLHGHDGVRRWWENWFSVFPDYDIEVLDLGALGDRIVAALRALGHGAGSDLPFEDTIWLTTRWRRGKCVWWRTFYTRDDALEAAGLSE